MYLSSETLTSIIRTGSTILVTLVGLVNSVIIFLSKITLLSWIIFLLTGLTLTLNLALFDLFLSSSSTVCSKVALLPLENSNQVIFSVSIHFSSDSKKHSVQLFVYSF